MTPRVHVGAVGNAKAGAATEVHSIVAPIPGSEYVLPAPAARHVAHALRMHVGQALTLFTGAGGEYATTIARIDRRDVVVRVLRHDAVERESPWPVTLVQAVIAADMMDLVVRKAVELGVAAIVPVQAARSQRLPHERALRRIDHWRQIAVAACEQCGRNRVPDVMPIAGWSDWIAGFGDHGKSVAILDADARHSLAALATTAPPRVIAIGPEGGFTAEELRQAGDRGAVAVHVGRRVLRAETAALAALATLDALAGDAR